MCRETSNFYNLIYFLLKFQQIPKTKSSFKKGLEHLSRLQHLPYAMLAATRRPNPFFFVPSCVGMGTDVKGPPTKFPAQAATGGPDQCDCMHDTVKKQFSACPKSDLCDTISNRPYFLRNLLWPAVRRYKGTGRPSSAERVCAPTSPRLEAAFLKKAKKMRSCSALPGLALLGSSGGCSRHAGGYPREDFERPGDAVGRGLRVRRGEC